MEEMSVEPAKVAFNTQFSLIGLNAVDRGSLTLIPEPGELLAAALDHEIEPVVTLRGEVGGGPGRHALADGPTVENRDAPAGPGEFVCHRHPGDAGTDNDHVGGLFLVEGRGLV